MAEDEKDKLKIFEDSTKQLERELNNDTKIWNDRVKKVTDALKGDIKKLIEVQAEVISLNQIVSDEIRTHTLQLYKSNVNIKELMKQRYEFYSTKYQINIKNDTTKKGLVEADLARIQYRSDLLEIHISFLRDTSKDFESLNYAIKNRIELANIYGID